MWTAPARARPRITALNEPFQAGDAAVIRRNPWVMALAASPVALSSAAFLAAVVMSSPVIVPFAVLLFIHGVLGALYAWTKNPRPREVAGRLEADAGGLSFCGAPLLDRAEITEGFVVPRAGRPPLVRLSRRGRMPAAEIRVRDEAEGRRLLRTLGLDASQTVATFDLPSRVITDARLRVATFGAAGLLAGLTATLGRLLAPDTPEIGAAVMLLPLFAALWLSRRSQTRLHVGADGLLLTWLRSRRFVPYGDVERLDTYEEGRGKNRWTGVDVWLTSGERMRVPISAKRHLGGVDVALVATRIREAMESHRLGDAAADASLLCRGALAIPAWIRAMRALGSGANAAHRTAPIVPERLWRVVEDPSADPGARAGAAVALATDADDAGRARLRAAARAAAAPKLRIAIEAAAGEFEAELAQALEEIAAGEEARAAAPRRR